MICFLIVAVLLVSLAPAAFAAGSASMSGPAVVRAGDTITVSFVAGGGILGGSGSVSYDTSKLTLKGYTQIIGGSWAVEFSGDNFVFYDNSMASPINGSTTIFTATFTCHRYGHFCDGFRCHPVRRPVGYGRRFSHLQRDHRRALVR